MSRSPWHDYLDEFAGYLEQVRLDIEHGTSASLLARPEVTPEGSVPEDSVGRARLLLDEARSLLLFGERRKDDVATRLAMITNRTRVVSRLISIDEQL